MSDSTIGLFVVAMSKRATLAPAEVSARAYWLPRRPRPPVTIAILPSSRKRSLGACEGIETGYRPVTYRTSLKSPANGRSFVGESVRRSEYERSRSLFEQARS